MAEDGSSPIDNISYPLNYRCEVPSEIFCGDISHIHYFVFEVVSEKWFHTSHNLENMCNSNFLKTCFIICTLKITKIKLWYNSCYRH